MKPAVCTAKGRVWWNLALLLLLSGWMWAQTGTAVLVGDVNDQNGAALAGATVTVTNINTGARLVVTTDNAGVYRVPGLPAGQYEVRYEHAQFATAVRSLTLAVAQQAEVNLNLKVGTVKQQVTAVAETPLVDTVSSAVSGLVSPSQMRDLPLNGRDIYQLVLLQTGVAPTTSSGPSPFQKGSFSKAAVNGQRPTGNNLTIDGMDANEPNFNISPGGAAGLFLGVDAIEEFRVFTNTYTAEYGRSPGSIIQAITKSGTNRWHGSLFEFHRNAALDAKNFFDLADRTIPPFVRNQFGGALGGPIQRDKTFFFAAYEGFRESLGVTAASTVLNRLAHSGQLPPAGAPPGTCTERNPTGCVSVSINPAVVPFLNIIPAANGTDFGNGTAGITSSARQNTREDYGLVRLDHAFSSKHSVFARYIMDDSDSLVPYLSTLVPGFPGRRDIRNQYFTAQDQKFFGTRWLNQFALGFNRTAALTSIVDTHPGLTISLVPNRPVGVFAIGGIGAVGNNLVYPLGTYSNTFQLQDNLSWTMGKHALKFGGEYRYMQLNGPFDLFVNGEYVFQDLSAFGITPASNNGAVENFLKGAPFIFVGTDPALSNSRRSFRQHIGYWYVQDDWRATPRLTLNLGMRHEFYSNPREAKGLISNIHDVATDAAPIVGKIFASTPKDLFAPRVGFAYALTSDHKTVLRGGAGVFNDQIWGNLYGNARSLPPFYKAFFAIFPTFLNPLNAVAVAPTANATMTYTPKFPVVYQYNLNVQRELGANTVAKVGYIGSRGNHLVRMGEANPFVPATGSRINPNFGSIIRIVTDAQSFYNGLQASVDHRMAGGLTAQVNYTYAHSTDDASGAFPSDWVNESGKSQNLFDRKGDRGRSGFDIRHNLVLNVTYQLPFGPGKALGRDASGVMAAVIGGWQVSGIGSFHSNVPFTPVLAFDNAGTQSLINSDRPNQTGNPYTGTCPNGQSVGTVTCWFNPGAYAIPPAGSFGNAGRNSLKGPDYKDFDLALLKNIGLAEGKTLEFRAEFFNLANHPNFAVPANTQGPNGVGGNGDAVFLGPNSPAGNAGQIFSTVNPSRQIQFGLKLIF